ncbi:MAG: phage terminase family protein [Anaerolineae bacterium]|nr:phage terminase family protein [Anaerolineae bacterium]
MQTLTRSIDDIVDYALDRQSSNNGDSLNAIPDVPDIVDWGQDRFYITETKRPIVLEPVQKTVLQYFFERREDGQFKYKTGLYSTIKKSGKTTIAAMVQQWACETWGDYGQCYHMGNKLEQAKERAFMITTRSIELSPFKKDWRIQPTRLTHLPTHSFIKPLPVNAAGEAGGNQRLTTWTEFHGYIYEADERMYDELQPVPTQPLSFRFVESYAGYDGESNLLKTIWERAIKEGKRIHDEYPIYVHEPSGLIAYIDTGTEARRMYWQTPEYYQLAEAGERPINFKRLHLNEWVSSENQFVQIGVWDSLENTGEKAIKMPFNYPVVIAVDAAVSNDSTAASAVTFIDDTTIELETQIFDPPKGGKIDYEETLKPALESMFARYRVVAVGYDEYQMHDFMTQLAKAYTGIEFTPFSQTQPRLQADTALLSRLIQGKFRHSGNAVLREHVQNANAKEHDDGRVIRIVKQPSGKRIDGLVAVSMASRIASIALKDLGPAVHKIRVREKRARR